MKRKITPKTILFVCTGNTCRSPMAEYLFKQTVTSLGLTKLKIISAGTNAKVGDKINPKTAQILKEKGICPRSFKAKQVDESMLKDSLAIICMTDSQRDTLMEMRWQVLRAAGEEDIENNVYSFLDIAGYPILDPYGKDIECYRYVYELIAGGIPALMDKILPQKLWKNYIPKPRKSKKEKEL